MKELECRVCGVAKEIDKFEKNKTKALGVTRRCLDCSSAYKLQWSIKTNQKEKRKAYFAAYNKTALANQRKADWKRRNPEKNAAIDKAWRLKNPRKQVQYARNFYEKYPHKVLAQQAKRRARQIGSIPAWADQERIAEIYREARKATRRTGIKHSVDHIVPLKSAVVCGLHVEQNLRVVPHTQNCRKYNTFEGVWE